MKESSIKRINNILLILIILVIGATWSYFMFGSGGSLPNNETRIKAEIEERLVEHATLIETEAKELAAELLPPVMEAIEEQLGEDYPRYLNSIKQEGSKLGDNLQEIFVDAVARQYRDYLTLHRQVLADEFPDHADEEAIDELIAEFEKVIRRIVERYYLDELRGEAEKTAQYWSRFEVLDPPAENQDSLEQQLVNYLADWTVLAFADRARDRMGIE